MPAPTGYGQFCPVAKAAEVLATRWTPLVLRELVSGSTRFNEIHRGVPLMSRALLSQRLKALEAAGIVERGAHGRDARMGEYRLTASGEALRPVIVAMGLWGAQWVESALAGPDWDAGVLMWDMRRRIDTAALPPGRTVLAFEYPDAVSELRRWWLLVEDDAVDLCQSDPGFDVDLHVRASVRAMGRVWIGQRPLRAALDAGEITLDGDRRLASGIGRWLGLSVIAEAARETPLARAS
jgi:DNA-binding HxlR family transcriptional regulator